jgi:hypothetical protein
MAKRKAINGVTTAKSAVNGKSEEKPKPSVLEFDSDEEAVG